MGKAVLRKLDLLKLHIEPKSAVRSLLADAGVDKPFISGTGGGNGAIGGGDNGAIGGGGGGDGILEP